MTYRVVSVMERNRYRISIYSSDNIVSTIILFVKDFGTHQCSHHCVVVKLCQFVSVVVSIVIQGHNVEGSTSFVFLTGLIQISLYLNSLVVLFLCFVHKSVSGIVTLKSFMSQLNDCLLFCIEIFLSFETICDVIVFIKPFCFSDIVRGSWVRPEYLVGVHVDVVVAYSLL